MVVIRLARGGAKKRPAYKIVVADSRKPRDGGFIEHIGYSRMGARGKPQEYDIDLGRYSHWCAQGANPSDAVRKIVRLKSKALKSAEAAGPADGPPQAAEGGEAAEAVSPDPQVSTPPETDASAQA